MLTKRRLLLAAIVALLVTALYGPLHTLKCRLAGEPFYRGKPASHWSHELRQWGFYVERDSGKTDVNGDPLPRGSNWFHDIPAWAEWTIENVPSTEWLVAKCIPHRPVPFLGASEEASGVLLVLLEDDVPKVRRIAAFLLGGLRVGGEPAIINAALRLRLKDNDPEVRQLAIDSLRNLEGRGVIDKEIALGH